jgi:membrane complex biogenesis BtpA family protein
MVHLLPLPGSPLYRGSLDRVITTAIGDAANLLEAGFPALMVENFGDSPFHASRVPPETVAAMTVAVMALRGEGAEHIGVNVLRNDAHSALGIAAATEASFIRVNVLTGTMYTDQGPIIGDAAALMRLRATLCPEVAVWADVLVKHATPPPGIDLARTAHDTVTRGLADAVIVSGSGTGSSPDLESVKMVWEAVPPGTRVVIGSGADTGNLADLTGFADTVIVGSSIKQGGDPGQPVDLAKATRFIEKASSLGLI